ncbi:MAG: flippase-like domain-containing protein [Firmicutes bacterium]|nr:flippase-like domain-containing protein [Bacillota bacterium]
MQKSPDLKQRFFSLKTLFSFLLAFAIIYLLVTKMNTAKVFAVIKRADLAIYAAGFLVYYLTFPLRGLRFHVMLGNNGCAAPVTGLTRIVFISWFANCVVPAKLGDIFRAYLVKRRYCHPLVNTVGAIFAERVFDLFILYLLIGASGLVAFKGRIPHTMLIVLQTSFVILAVLAAVLVFMKYYSTRPVGWLPEKARDMYQRFLAGTISSFHHNWQIAALTAVIWFLEGVSFYMVTKAIGMNLSFAAVVFIGLISALLTALPVTPAGLGIVETAKVGVLVFFNVDGYVAVSAALLDRIINYWSLILFGFVIYLASEHSMPEEAGSDESDDSHSYVQ